MHTAANPGRHLLGICLAPDPLGRRVREIRVVEQTKSIDETPVEDFGHDAHRRPASVVAKVGDGELFKNLQYLDRGG